MKELAEANSADIMKSYGGLTGLQLFMWLLQ